MVTETERHWLKLDWSCIPYWSLCVASIWAGHCHVQDARGWPSFFCVFFPRNLWDWVALLIILQSHIQMLWWVYTEVAHECSWDYGTKNMMNAMQMDLKYIGRKKDMSTSMPSAHMIWQTSISTLSLIDSVRKIEGWTLTSSGHSFFIMQAL